jgi:hypothetical protein
MRHWSCISAFGLFCILAVGPATAASTENWTQKSLPESGSAIAYDEARHEVVQVVALPTGSASTWIWQGKGWTQKFPQNSPGFYSGAMAYDPVTEQTVFLTNQTSVSSAQTWIWDGSNWTQKFPSSSPSSGGYLAYDPRMKRLLQFGGTDNNGNPYGQTWTWDGNDWTLLSPSHSPSGGTGVLAYDHAKQQMVFFGGSPEAGQTWVWNGSDWTQQSPQNSPPAGNGLYGGTYDAAQKAIVVITYGSTTTETWSWTGANWVQGSPQVAPSALNPMAYDPAEKRAVMPVTTNITSSGNALAGVTWLWDGSNWIATAPSSGRTGPAMAATGSNKFLLFGGFNFDAELLNDTWLGDGSVWTQQFSATSPSPRTLPAMAFDESRNQVVLFGGNNGTAALADTWVWKNGQWKQVFPPSSPPARWAHAMAYDKGREEVVLFGGYSGSGVLADTWVWNGYTWTDKVSSTTPPARQSPAMAYSPHQRQMVLFGGSGASGLLADTWTWDGKSWTQQLPATSPAARSGSGMAYDAGGQQILLFGGAPVLVFPNIKYFSDTWAWNGTTWTAVSPGTTPPGRAFFGMASDAESGPVLIYGGQQPTTPIDFQVLADAWSWSSQPQQ